MLLEKLFINEKGKRTGRLIFRFMISTSFLFLFFIILSFIFLSKTSDKNLFHYYRQEYVNTRNLVDNILKRNKEYIITLSDLPQLKELFDQYLEYYRRYKIKEGVPFNVSNEINGPLMMQFSESMDSTDLLLSEVNSMPVKFISGNGILLAGAKPEELYRQFHAFEKLQSSSTDDKGFGVFFVMERNIFINKDYFIEPVIYFFAAIRDEAGGNAGYIAVESRLGMLTGNITETGVGPGVDVSVKGKDDIYSLSKRVNRYLTDNRGRPITPLLLNGEYSEKLESIGFTGDYRSIPLMNPRKLKNTEAIPDRSNIELIDRLVSEKPYEMTGFGKKYRNYLNSRVIGAGFWIEEFDFGIVMEIGAVEAFAPYVNSLILVFIILAINFTVFLYLILWINNLRIEALDANPLTKLPGNRILNEKIQNVINAKAPAAVVYGDLDNFKAFNDAYGFSRGDDVICFTAELLKKVISHFPSVYTFCGHIGGDDFIFIVESSDVHNAADEISGLFDEGIRKFYNKKHLDDGYIEEKNRQGQIIKYPIMSLSMAGILINKTGLSHYLEVAERCGELKKIAKKTPGSILVLDRRSNMTK